MKRDFIYIDDIISGTISILESFPKNNANSLAKVYNIGNNKPVNLMKFIIITLIMNFN